MKFRAGATALFVAGGLFLQPIIANAFTFGSYCIKLSSSTVSWQVPKNGSYEIYSFSYINSCQKVIPSVQVDLSEDVSGGNTSRWNTLSDVFALQNVTPGQQGNLQISISYDKYVSARYKIYLRALESESISSGGTTTNTTNITIQNITFSSVRSPATTAPTSTLKSSKKSPTPTPTPSKKSTLCTKSEVRLYEKAKYQFILSNTQIQRANDIKNIVEDARQAKSRLLGYFVDYSQKDQYTLSRQDATIEEYKIHRDEWTPTLQKLAKKCKKQMPTKTDLLETFYQD
jgi:hypothetical protein